MQGTRNGFASVLDMNKNFINFTIALNMQIIKLSNMKVLNVNRTDYITQLLTNREW